MAHRGQQPGDGAPDDERAPLVVAPATRAALLAGAVGVGAAAVAWSATLAGGRDAYLLAHAATAAPFLAVACACTWRAARAGAPEHRPFWALWLVGCAAATGASLAGVGAAASDSGALLGLSAALVLAGQPFWVTATMGMVRAQVGRRSVSVDVIDAALALAVLGAPVVLVVAEPLARSDDPALALPLAVTAVVMPGAAYLGIGAVSTVGRARRVGFGIGVALAVVFGADVALHLVRVLGAHAVPLPGLVAAHAATMTLLLALPLWAPRRAVTHRTVSRPDGRAGEGSAADRPPRRNNPMAYVSALGLPMLAVPVLAGRDERPWGVPFLVGLLLAVIALNAVRYTALSRETRQLYGDVTRMSEERRRLLSDMLRALEDDRQRTAAELHAQAIGSLTALAATIQAAYVALPADTALAVKGAVSDAHRDLARRAEELRRLMVAMRPPALDPVAGNGKGCGEGSASGAAAGAAANGVAAAGGGAGGGADGAAPHALAAALRAYASAVFGDRPAAAVDVDVDSRLELDWSTGTIAYRIVQEALLDAARHARASRVAVRVAARDVDGALVVEVRDDGTDATEGGGRPSGPGTSRAAMELFAQLGRGELDVRPADGGGTVVRAVLNVFDPSPPPPAPRLRLVSPPD
ncbi:MAG TPA: hypothetical protein VIL48_09835 [Acidimicrobiales bacterium]